MLCCGEERSYTPLVVFFLPCLYGDFTWEQAKLTVATEKARFKSIFSIFSFFLKKRDQIT